MGLDYIDIDEVKAVLLVADNEQGSEHSNTALQDYTVICKTDKLYHIMICKTDYLTSNSFSIGSFRLIRSENYSKQ